MDREQAKDLINQQKPTFLQAAKKGYICPTCGNGSGQDGTGISRDPQTGRWKCFKCGLYEDIIGLYGSANGIQDYPAQLQGAADYYHISIDQEAPRQYQSQGKTERNTQDNIHTNTYTQQQPQDFTLFYRAAAAHLQETDYPQRRGLSLEICKKYGLGFIENWKHPKAPNAPASPRLIIPVTEYSYLARDTRAELTGEQDKYKKQLCKSTGKASWTFNRQALQESEKPVFVVEGAIDALSIIEAGGEAVAISSTAYITRFIEELREHRPAQPLIIALDNDAAGKATADKLETGLRELHIPFYRHNPAGIYKDANERLTADRAGLEEAVAKAGSLEDLRSIEEQERMDAYLQNSAAAHLQEFVDGIKENANTPALPTGFSRLDAALDGGLYPGLYILGAISSLGKTTFALQLADQLAQRGQDVLIFSLEMARSELMAKSISRHTLQEVLETGGDARDAKTTRGITDGKRYLAYSETEHALIQTAIQKYGQYANGIYIVEGVGDIGAAQIRGTVEEHITFTGRPPVVLVDYLQILAPYNERSTDKQNTDKAVLELKRISRDFNTPVIAVSSLNRMNYNNAITMEAFKESGAIEYSADILIGLQLAGAGTTGFDATREKTKDPRKIELVILKNRNGRTGDKITYYYYPLFNFFTEA